MTQGMQEIDFYQKHLDQVSRSFAFCIQKLEPPFRQWVSLSYLLCRVLDTIEDSPWNSAALQDRHYQDFNSFMSDLPPRESVSRWASLFPESIPESEKLLLQECFLLFEDLHHLPPEARSILQTTVGKMYLGMQHYSRRSAGGNLRLTDLTDVNRYCYFVAGVVGELLSELYLVYRPEFEAPSDFHVNSLHFGLFLQKVNLLKDQRTDELEGRFLVPDRKLLMASLRENARGALDYLKQLPESEKGYRTFCGWSLFLGAASIPWMQRSFEEQDATKIPRALTQELLSAVEEIIQKNASLEESFAEYEPLLPQMEIPRVPPSDSDWFRELAGSSLGSSELFTLRMI